MTADVTQGGNLFPREDILEAVAESDWRDRGVPVAAWWLAALGLAGLAAGTPALDVVVRAPTEFSADTTGAAWLRPVHALAGAIGRTGIGIEATWFFLSALAFGVALPAIGLALRPFGFGARLRFVTALAAVCAPFVVTSARLASDFTLGVVAASLVMAACASPFDSGERGARGFGVRLGAALLVGCAIRPDMLSVAPALLVAAWTLPGPAARIAVVPVVLATVAAVAAWFVAGDGATGMEHLHASSLVRAAVSLGLAGAALWITVPLTVTTREAEESPPPQWLTAWLVGAMVWTIATPATSFASVAAPIVPALAALFAGVLGRRARPDGASRWATGAIVFQVMAAALIGAGSPRTDTAFTTSRGELLADDVVVHDEGEDDAAFLLRRRHGLRVVGVNEDATAGGRRVQLGAPPHDAVLCVDAVTGKLSPAGEDSP